MKKGISIFIAVEAILLAILMIVFNFRLVHQKKVLISYLASLNEEQLKLEEQLEKPEKENNENFEEVRIFYNVERYLRAPTSKKVEFEEAVKFVQSLGYTNARDLVFKIYMEYTIETKYAEYISEKGIMQHKASYMRRTLLPEYDTYTWKVLYNENNIYGTANFVNSSEVIIPQELLIEAKKMDRFLSGMEESFPRHN